MFCKEAWGNYDRKFEPKISSYDVDINENDTVLGAIVFSNGRGSSEELLLLFWMFGCLSVTKGDLFVEIEANVIIF